MQPPETFFYKSNPFIQSLREKERPDNRRTETETYLHEELYVESFISTSISNLTYNYSHLANIVDMHQ